MSNSDKKEPSPLKTDVSLKIVEHDTQGELSDELHFECSYCEKPVILPLSLCKLYEKLNDNDFYCSFCLRHRFYTKHNHILMLSFRSIIGYYYRSHYLTNFAGKKIYYAEINDYINCHEQVGLLNPVFSYDPESYIWFIDFSRVGKGKCKIQFEECLKTISNILMCFNLSLHTPNIRMNEFYERYKSAMEKFYQQRNRPYGRKILIPTLSGCGVYEHHSSKIEETRNFSSSDFIRKLSS